jgi:hypothetical protein
MSDHHARPETDADDLLARVPAEVEPPAALRDQVVGSLRAQGLLRGTPTSSPSFAYWALTAAAAVLAFLGGRASANDASPIPPDLAVAPATPGLAVPEGSSAWALLLFEDGRFDAGDQSPEVVARTYDAWARVAAARGFLILAEKFADEETLLVDGEATTRPVGFVIPPGMLGGMFVVVAPTREAALALARETPHHEMGGIVLMREFDRTSRQ